MKEACKEPDTSCDPLLPTLCEADFVQMEALEKRAYPSEYITPGPIAWSWYERFDYTTFAAAEEGRITGFINLFPVRDAVFERIRCGRFNDRDLTCADIADLYAPGHTPLNMLLSCIVVAEDQRGRGLSERLLRAAAAFYRPHAHRFRLIVTDNVTEAGRRFSERHGFSLLCETAHGSRLYGQPYCAFERRICGPEA